MTFVEHMTAYSNYFKKRGEAWLAEYMEDLLERSVSTYELVSYEMQMLTKHMYENGPRGPHGTIDMIEYGYAWSRRDHLMYMMTDWNKHLVTGKIYF